MWLRYKFNSNEQNKVKDYRTLLVFTFHGLRKRVTKNRGMVAQWNNLMSLAFTETHHFNFFFEFTLVLFSELNVLRIFKITVFKSTTTKKNGIYGISVQWKFMGDLLSKYLKDKTPRGSIRPKSPSRWCILRSPDKYLNSNRLVVMKSKVTFKFSLKKWSWGQKVKLNIDQLLFFLFI